MDVHGVTIDHCPSARYRTSQRSPPFGQGDRNRPLRCDKPILLAVSPPNRRIPCIAELCRSFRHDSQYRLDICRRAGDHPEDLTRRGLLLQRLLELLEQPYVLDCDYGLVGESFEELDLRWSERTNLKTTRRQRSNKFA